MPAIDGARPGRQPWGMGRDPPGETLRYEADGLSMLGGLHRPAGAGTTPGVLVFPEAAGLGAHTLARAGQVARELGYVALACDLWGERREIEGLEAVTSARAALWADPPGLRARVTAPLAALRAQPGVDASRIAAIGFCSGGTMAFELATCSDIRAAVGFHPGLHVPSLPRDAHRITASILALLGDEDPSVRPAARKAFAQALSAAGVDWQITLYGGVVHSFTNKDAHQLAAPPDFARYDPRADRRSWAQMAALLTEAFA